MRHPAVPATAQADRDLEDALQNWAEMDLWDLMIVEAKDIAQPCPSCGGDNALEEVVAALRLVAADLKARDDHRLRSYLSGIVSELHSANAQRAPGDDQIIADHIASALADARYALGLVQ